MPYETIDIKDQLPVHKTKRWKRRKKIKRIIIHTTGSDNQSPFKTARYHINAPNHISKTGCAGLCYHDYIVKAGEVYLCNDYWLSTWHVGSWNKTSIGVVMAFDGDNEAPGALQYAVMLEHVTNLCLQFKVLPKMVRGHREAPGMVTLLGKGSKKYKSVCPGMAINLDIMRDHITKNVQSALAAEGLYDGEIDGLFGKKSLKAWELYYV